MSIEVEPTGRIVANGKQVLLDGRHLCDACDEPSALAIASALEFVGISFSGIPVDASEAIAKLLE